MAETQALALDDREPWDHLEGEPDHCYRAFVIYRDHDTKKMSPVHAAVRQLSGLESTDKGTLYNWLALYNWQERARAWTQMRQRHEDNATLQAITEMKHRHAVGGRLAFDAGTTKLEQMIANPDQIQRMNPQTAGQLMQIGSGLEQQALGVAQTSGTAGARVGIQIVIHTTREHTGGDDVVDAEIASNGERSQERA